MKTKKKAKAKTTKATKKRAKSRHWRALSALQKTIAKQAKKIIEGGAVGSYRHLDIQFADKEILAHIKEEDSSRFDNLLNYYEDDDCYDKKPGEVLDAYKKCLKEKRFKNNFVVEMAPCARNIPFEGFSLFEGMHETQLFYLNLPYIQFYNLKGSLFVTCSNKPVKNGNSTVFHLPFPNGGASSPLVPICLGTSKPIKTPQDCIDAYFRRTFNDTHTDYVEFPKEIKNYRVWEKNSRLNPNFALTVNWHSPTVFSKMVFSIIAGIESDDY